MDKLPKDDILEYNENTLIKVRESFGLEKSGVMENVVNILEEWVKEQDHFTKKNFDRRYLESTIIASKGSLERAKSKLDRSCTLRTLMPLLFGAQDIRLFFQTDLKDIRQAVLPKMTKNNERIYILSNSGKKFQDTLLTSFNLQLTYISEYVRRNDYAESFYVVLDYMDVNLLELIKAIPLGQLQETVAYLLDCCAFRLKVLYIISSSKFVGAVVSLFKQALPAKLVDRVQVLKDRKSLKNIFDEDILPKEYGGNEKHLLELHEKWLDVLTSKDHQNYLTEINSARTEESKRLNTKFNEEYLGMPGSFRKLDVD